MEEWRPVPPYEDRYEVSNLGRVRRLRRTTKLVLPNGKAGHRLEEAPTGKNEAYQVWLRAHENA